VGLLEFEGIPAGIFEATHFQIDIEVGPAEVMVVEELDMEDLADRGVLEPRVLLIGQVVLPPIDTQPDAMAVNMDDLNGRSVLSRRFGCHPDVPQYTAESR
jgi:hypothetical protein